MSHTRLTQATMRVVRRHPVAAGLALWLLGGLVTWQSLQQGSESARYVGGTAVTGELIEITDAGTVTPDYRMRVRWSDAAGVTRESQAQAYRSDLKRYQPGDPVALRVATDDPDAVIPERVLRNRGLLRFGGVVVTPMVYAGGALVLGGLFLMLTGNRFLNTEP